jgi:UDP-N-acetylglucosamine:LPS N-acetylglucosamine transferase
LALDPEALRPDDTLLLWYVRVMLEEAPTAAEALREPSAEVRSESRVWLVFADLMANRVFFQCGIVDSLRRAMPGRLGAVFVVHEKHVRPWLERLEGIPLLYRDELMPVGVSLGERVVRRLDIELDKRIGFYPLAIRHSLRHGFHRGRWTPGHPYPFLDSDRVGPLPRWRVLEPLMARWHLSARRYVPSVLLERMRRECEAVVITNPQAHFSMPFLTAARRLDLPVVGYIASWDHPVGKGIVPPHLDRYIVQNETMGEDLRRYHGIEPARVTVTGWPQTDVFHRRRPRQAYHELLRGLELDADRPVVLFAGNSPNNAPYEGNLVSRLVSWWRESGAHERFSLLFRPHPYDDKVDERFAAAFDEPGAAVQKRSLADFDDLATLLQHVDCVVANAGTILLEALVNQRPSVCVTFDEGAPAGRPWADLNLTGEHYRKLMESAAFYRASNFEELVVALDRALGNPEELSAERQRVAREVVGEIDGRAAERVAAAIQESVPSRLLSSGAAPHGSSLV